MMKAALISGLFAIATGAAAAADEGIGGPVRRFRFDVQCKFEGRDVDGGSLRRECYAAAKVFRWIRAEMPEEFHEPIPEPYDGERNELAVVCREKLVFAGRPDLEVRRAGSRLQGRDTQVAIELEPGAFGARGPEQNELKARLELGGDDELGGKCRIVRNLLR